MKPPVQNRQAAGRQLAGYLQRYRGRDDLIVLALPRGGIPVAAEIATALEAPLDVLLVRKLGLPGHPELAMGAIASGGVQVVNEQVVRQAKITHKDIEAVAAREKEELKRRERTYRGDRPWPSLKERTVILVDDGLATGATMQAAIAAVKKQQPNRIIVAVPVAPPDTVNTLTSQADEIVCPLQPQPFMAIGQWYGDFHQVSDSEVVSLLKNFGAKAGH